MVYSFQAPSNGGNKKIKKLLKRVKNINFMHTYGPFIFLGITAVSYIGTILMNNLSPYKLLDGHSIVLLILCCCFAGFLTSFYNALSDENKTYKKLSKELKSPVFVNFIEEHLAGEDAEIADGIEIPELHINYDVNSAEGNVAVLVKLDDENYRIVHKLETDKVQKKLMTVVSSKSLADGIKRVESENGFIILSICCIKKENNGFIKFEDIDHTAVCEEAFLPMAQEE